MADLIGLKLGQYEVLDQLGRGGMATVYRARQESMNREVAVKLLHKSLLEQDATFIERFRREAQVIAKLQHPHILPVYDFGEHDGQPYLVMALLSGGSLPSASEARGRCNLTRWPASCARWPRRWTSPTSRTSSTATSSPPTCCSTGIITPDRKS